MKKFWRVWKFAIGSFSDEQTKEYDNVVAITRTFLSLWNNINQSEYPADRVDIPSWRALRIML